MLMWLMLTISVTHEMYFTVPRIKVRWMLQDEVGH